MEKKLIYKKDFDTPGSHNLKAAICLDMSLNFAYTTASTKQHENKFKIFKLSTMKV